MKRSFWPMWGWPIAIAVSTLAGLIAGLVGDDGWDVLAAVALGVPALAAAWLGTRRGTRPGTTFSASLGTSRRRQSRRAP